MKLTLLWPVDIQPANPLSGIHGRPYSSLKTVSGTQPSYRMIPLTVNLSPSDRAILIARYSKKQSGKDIDHSHKPGWYG